MASELIGILIRSVDAFSKSEIKTICSNYADIIEYVVFLVLRLFSHSQRSGKSLEILPKLLNHVSFEEEKKSSESGSFKDSFLNTLCNKVWPSEAVVRFANMFRDIPLADGKEKFIELPFFYTLQIITSSLSRNYCDTLKR